MIELKLYEYMRELLKQTPTTFVRYKYDDISWIVVWWEYLVREASASLQ